jgi:hypothetical protein
MPYFGNYFGLSGTSVISPQADPARTTAFTTTRHGDGSLAGGTEIRFRLSQSPPDDQESFGHEKLTATSDITTAVLEIGLLKNAVYVARREGGRSVVIETDDSDTLELPPIPGPNLVI